jgi:hypothetical protein
VPWHPRKTPASQDAPPPGPPPSSRRPGTAPYRRVVAGGDRVLGVPAPPDQGPGVLSPAQQDAGALASDTSAHQPSRTPSTLRVLRRLILAGTG